MGDQEHHRKQSRNDPGPTIDLFSFPNKYMDQDVRDHAEGNSIGMLWAMGMIAGVRKAGTASPVFCQLIFFVQSIMRMPP